MLFLKGCLILFFSFFIFPLTQHHNEVHPGPCLDYGNRFCEEKVDNSFCFKKKNKCYCRPQFVRIKESYGVTCKTLLTNLKCSTDNNCRDVEGSVCHPGPGVCTCPYSTIYVSDVHACKRQVVSADKNVQECITCREKGGICFIQKNSNPTQVAIYTETSEKFKSEYGCSCPGLTTNRNFNQVESMNEMCTTIMVDLGSPCNDQDILCRSSKAICVDIPYFPNPVCMCPPNYAAVYQQFLGYHECYPNLKLNEDLCQPCSQTGGYCYDMNGDLQPDGCQCGRLKVVEEDNKMTSDLNQIQQICSKMTVEVFCWPENLRVCYYPPKGPIHSRLFDNLTKKRALIFLTDSVSMSGDNNMEPNSECLLTKDESHNARENVIRFCIEKQLNTIEHSLPCGISATKYSNGYLYSGYISLWIDKYFPDPINDQLIDFSCKCDYSFLRVTPGQAIDRSWPLDNSNFNYRQTNESREFFNFSLLNAENIIVHTVTKMAPIKLNARLDLEATEYQHFSAESCWCFNATDDNGITNRWKLINRGCIEPHSGFTTPFLISNNNNHQNDSQKEKKRFIELSSGFFPAFTMFDSSQLVFKCLFRFCKNKQWCTLTNPCSSQYPQYHTSPKPQTFDDIRFALQSFSISITLTQKTDFIPRGEVKAICSFFWCLPGDKLLLIISLLTVILLLVTALAFVLFRRHNQFTNIRSTIINDASQNNTFYKPSLSQLSHGYCPIPDELWKVNNYTMCSCIEDCSNMSSISRKYCKENLYPELSLTQKNDPSSLRFTNKILKHSTNFPIDQKNGTDLPVNPCDGYVSLFPEPEDQSTCHNNLESTEL